MQLTASLHDCLGGGGGGGGGGGSLDPTQPHADGLHHRYYASVLTGGWGGGIGLHLGGCGRFC